MDRVAQFPWRSFHGFYNEDGFISVNHRKELEREGFKFAPLDVAVHFSKEHEIPENIGLKTFMFQDLTLGYGTPNGAKIQTDANNKYISFMPAYGVESTRLWPSGNVTIQHAGTYVDNGYTLEVGGTTKFNGNSSVVGDLNVTGNITGATWSGTAIANNKLANSALTIGSTNIALGATSNTLAGLSTVTSTNFTGNLTGNVTGDVTGNAATATKLAATKNINGVAFDGSADITVVADAGTLSGTTLKSSVTGSSLTSVGTITSGIWSATAIDYSKLALTAIS